MVIGAGPLIFGYYTAALLAMASLALASGVQFAMAGLWQRHKRLHLSFALLCSCIAVLAAANARLHAAGSTAAAVTSLRWMIGASICFFPPFLVFIQAYTGQQVRWRMVAAATLLAGWFLWLNMRSAGTLLYADMIELSPLELPWGERLRRIGGTPTIPGLAFHLLSYLAFLWALPQALRQWRRGESLRALLLGACLLVQFGALLWGDVVVDAMQQAYPYVDSFAFLPFVLLMGASLANQLYRRTVELEHTTRQLEAEVDTRREAELSLRHVAYHDALTGLPNRLRALDHLADLHAEVLAGDCHGAVLLIDLDNFKTINEALSHQIGDHMLEAVADRLLAASPPEGLLARLGGDEFALLLGALSGDPATAQTQAMDTAQRIVGRLAEPVAVDSRILAVGASVGVALFPAADAGPADILRRADIALYRAKGAGRNAVRVFEAPMQQEADARLALERGLRTALEHKLLDTQFGLHFQPQVARDGRLLGVEALLRWQHPQLGEVPPGTFVPLAEETGLIHALGAWVMEHACAQIRAWDRDHVPFGRHMAVNVSAWQLSHPQFATNLTAQVRAAGVEPNRLTLELTESALLQDFRSALRTLRQLATAGFGLALDDFGTGYSSLNYLQRLPLDVLKIDRAFVRELQPDTIHPLTGFIVDIARRLGLSTIAEGVETEGQRLALDRLGCDGLQGFLICRPLDAAAFALWATDHARTYRSGATALS